MGGRAEPPEGTPEGGPGGEDEFRSVVFDESFVRAARIQELSAQERMSSGTRPARRRGLHGGGLSRQAVALMLVVSMAFAAAVYLGTRHPYPQVHPNAAELSISVFPLEAGASGVPTLVPSASATPTPTGSATGKATSKPTAKPSGTATASASATATASASATGSASPVPIGPGTEAQPNEYPLQNAGLGLPAPVHTDNFTLAQVAKALEMVQTYLIASSTTPKVLTGNDTDSVRTLLAAGQYPQFDQSVSKPVNDRRHQTTGWMVRFDPAQVKLVPSQPIRALGTVGFTQVGSNTLQLTSNSTFIYALQPVKPLSGPVPAVVLFTVHREITYRVTAADIDDGHLELSDSVSQVGATNCDADQSRYFQVLFPQPSLVGVFRPTPGAAATRVPGVDPFNQNAPAWDVCGVMTGPTP